MTVYVGMDIDRNSQAQRCMDTRIREQGIVYAEK